MIVFCFRKRGRMELKINVSKGHLYFLSLLIVVVVGVLFVKGQGGGGTPNPGHDASSVSISINGTFMTLQDAFDEGNLTTISINGTFMTLQDAFDEGNLTTDACNWEGVKCSCADDISSGEEGSVIVGLNCTNGILNDVIVRSIHITHNNGNCPENRPSRCDIYDPSGDGS